MCHKLLERKKSECSHSIMSKWSCHCLSDGVSVLILQQLDRLFYSWQYIFLSPLVDEWSPAWETGQRKNSNTFQSIRFLKGTKKELVLRTSHIVKPCCTRFPTECKVCERWCSSWKLTNGPLWYPKRRPEILTKSVFRKNRKTLKMVSQNAAYALGISKASYNITIIMHKGRDRNDVCF